jgi:hypothetical protein
VCMPRVAGIEMARPVNLAICPTTTTFVGRLQEQRRNHHASIDETISYRTSHRGRSGLQRDCCQCDGRPRMPRSASLAAAPGLKLFCKRVPSQHRSAIRPQLPGRPSIWHARRRLLPRVLRRRRLHSVECKPAILIDGDIQCGAAVHLEARSPYRPSFCTISLLRALGCRCI